MTRHLPVLLAALLALPALWGGLLMDDHWFLQTLQDPTKTPAMDLFVFYRADTPVDAWTFGPDLQIAFWRPLAALSHQLDFALSDSLALWHLHSWLWLLAAVGAAAALYRQVSPGWTALLAGVLFAVEDAHAFPVAWLANRNALMCVTFGLVALKWHDQGKRHLALLPFAAALLSAEAGLAAFAYFVAMEWRRPVRLLPHVALIAVWRGLYVWLGYGAVGSTAYIDPLSAEFVVALVERLPVLLMVQYLHVPGELWGLSEAGVRQAVTGLGWLYMLGLVALFLPLLKTDRVARMWGLGMLLALIPTCAVMPMDRVLVWVGVGAFGLLSRLPLVFADLSWMRRLKLAALLKLHASGAALLLPLRIVGAALLANFIREPLLDVEFAEDDVVVFLTGNDLSSVYLTGWRASEGLPGPSRAIQLGSATFGGTFERTDERTLLLTTPPLMTKPMENVTRNRPFEVGEVIRARDFETTILAVDGGPTRLRFVFDQPMEQYRVMAFDAGQRVDVTLEVGDSISFAPGVPGLE